MRRRNEHAIGRGLDVMRDSWWWRNSKISLWPPPTPQVRRPVPGLPWTSHAQTFIMNTWTRDHDQSLYPCWQLYELRSVAITCVFGSEPLWPVDIPGTSNLLQGNSSPILGAPTWRRRPLQTSAYLHCVGARIMVSCHAAFPRQIKGNCPFALQPLRK